MVDFGVERIDLMLAMCECCVKVSRVCLIIELGVAVEKRNDEKRKDT